MPVLTLDGLLESKASAAGWLECTLVEFLTDALSQMPEPLHEAASIRDLWASAIKAFPNTRKRQHAINKVAVQEVQWIPYAKLQMLLHSAKVLGEAYDDGKPRQTYSTAFVFRGVNFSKSPGQGFLKLNKEKTPLFFERLSMNQKLKLRCSCPDFRWRFNWECDESNALFGQKAPPYVPPNPEKYRGPVNPSGLPGVCKHLMNSALVLIKSGAAKL